MKRVLLHLFYSTNILRIF